MTISIPDPFRKTVLATFGDEGQRWLTELPQVCDFLMRSWNLKPDGEFKNLTFNFAMPVKTSNNEAAVLKLGPHKKGRVREVDALTAYNGNGAVKLLNSSPDHGALLLERAVPGTQLKEIYSQDPDEEKVCDLASPVFEKLLASEAARKSYTHVSTWGLGFEKYLRETDGAGEIQESLVNRADQLFKHLVRTSPSETLLHGDLHHFNILKNQNAWLSIDPKGLWGDPTFEVGAFVRNPMPDFLNFNDLEDRLLTRIQILADNLGFDVERVWGWSYAQSVLAAIWATRDQNASNDWLNVTSALEMLEDEL